MDVFVYDWSCVKLPMPIYFGIDPDSAPDVVYVTPDSGEGMCGMVYQRGSVSVKRLVRVYKSTVVGHNMYIQRPYVSAVVGYGMYSKPFTATAHSIWDRPSGPMTDIALVVYDYGCSFYVRKRDVTRLNHTITSLLTSIPRVTYNVDYWVETVTCSLLRTKFDTPNDKFYRVHAWCPDKLEYVANELHRVSGYKITLYEREIPHVTSFLNHCNILSSGWVRVKAPVGDMHTRSMSSYLGYSTISTCIELHVSHADITESSVNKPSIPLVLSMDIETYTPRHSSFPMSHNVDDNIRMIGTSTKWHGSTECRCVLFAINTVERDMDKSVHVVFESGTSCVIWYHSSTFTTDDGNAATLVLLDTEVDMIIAYMHYVKCMKPHVIIGWNHTSYDYSYICDRYYAMSRIRVNYSRSLVNKMSFETINWSSSAYKYNNFTLIRADGIVDIDVMQHLMKHETYKQYSLKYISTIELQYAKIDLPYHEIFKLLESKSYDDLITVATYCVRDTMAPMQILEKKRVWLTVVEMSRVVRSLPADLLVRGSGAKILSQVHYECKNVPWSSSRPYYVMNPELNKASTYTTYEGAYVIEPRPGLYDHVVSLDFASLYPSIIIHDNICYTTLIHAPGCHTIRCTDTDYAVVYVCLSREHIRAGLQPYVATPSVLACERDYIPAGCKEQLTSNKLLLRFVFNKRKTSVIPELIKRLIHERNKCKTSMKSCTPDERDTWDRRQYSYKIAANSIYGILGSKNNMLMFTIAAACVTARGRQHLADAQRIIEHHGGTVVYGDTDSCFLTIPGVRTYDEYTTRCSVICDDISKLNDGVVNMQFENMFVRLLLLGKKRYACLRRDGTIYRRGIASVRRTKSTYFTNTYNDLINIILDRSQAGLVLTYVKEIVFDVFGSTIEPDNLACLQRWSGQPSHLEQHMKRIGRNVEAGQYMCYVPVHGPWTPATPVASRLRDKDWCVMYDIPIDYLHYVKHELMQEFDNTLALINCDKVVTCITSLIEYCIMNKVVPDGIDNRVSQYLTSVLGRSDSDLLALSITDHTHALT